MLDRVAMSAEDSALAEDLQVEEVLRFSIQSGKACAVCKEGIRSLDASWKPENCDHVICIACFCQYAPETEATGLPRCAVASCDSLCNTETHQGTNVPRCTSISIEDMDRKGKKPLGSSTIQELGQCSRGASTNISSELYCAICMETVHIGESFPVDGCTHTFCISCVSQCIAAKVEENVLSIGCPAPGCKDGVLHPDACRDVIPAQLFQRLGAALCDSSLGSLKFYCPFKECSALLVDDPGHGEEVITNVECPHCCRMFCAQCKVPWHAGVTCAEFQRLGKDERGREDLLLRKVAQESKWQRCPKCKIYVERIEGCVFIICRCGHCFCYLCASPMSRDNHCCKTCNRTW
uniref:RBR-type E3 ubiquitin transferase n=1 Tax=Zea mays TaxID=4577 RepID=B6SL08_MAIZE|nr:ubiquitin-protein ligase/ zinc ion binding protein [Zea mays]|eukprot:NP_001147119.1 ubiquitin-protein ligase/ zinc ion binding protein [Zea mays]